MILGGNCPEGNCPVAFDQGVIIGEQSSRGQLFEGNYPGGNFPRGKLSGYQIIYEGNILFVLYFETTICHLWSLSHIIFFKLVVITTDLGKNQCRKVF